MTLETTDVGQKFLSALLDEDVSHFIRRGNLSHLFMVGELPVYKKMREHVTLYGKLPQYGTLLLETKLELASPTEPADYYYNQCVKRFLDRELRESTEDVKHSLLDLPGSPSDPVGAYESLCVRLQKLQVEIKGSQLIDFRDAADIVWSLYMSAVKGDNKGKVQLGWPYLDSSDMGGGLFAGDVVSFVGRPQRGKTWMMLWTAMHNWSIGRVPLFVSMEMDIQLILLRLAGLFTGIEAKKIKSGNLSPLPLKAGGIAESQKLKKGLSNLSHPDHPFWVLDGNLASSVPEIRTYTKQLKPDVVLIDGAYLLGHEDKRLNQFNRVAANCELIKRELATGCGIPVVNSFQFNRVAAKKLKKQEDAKNSGKAEVQVDLEDIAHSDAIGQISSIVLGFFEDVTPENLITKRIDVMKGRGGEQGVFNCNWNFKKMDFGQIIEKTEMAKDAEFGDELGYE